MRLHLGLCGCLWLSCMCVSVLTEVSHLWQFIDLTSSEGPAVFVDYCLCLVTHTNAPSQGRAVGSYNSALHLLQQNLGLQRSWNCQSQPEQRVLAADVSSSVEPSFLVILYHILSPPAAVSPQRAVCQWQHSALGGLSTQPLTHLIRQTLRGGSQAYACCW